MLSLRYEERRQPREATGLLGQLGEGLWGQGSGLWGRLCSSPTCKSEPSFRGQWGGDEDAVTPLTDPLPTLPRASSLSLEAPQRRVERLTPQPSSLPPEQVSPPEHRLWPHCPAASDLPLGRGASPPPRAEPSRGACAPPPGAPTQTVSTPAGAACLQSPRRAADPEFKAGQEVGKRGRGRQRGWVLGAASVGPDSSPGRPRLAPQTPAHVPGRGGGARPGLRCACGARAARVPRVWPAGRSPGDRASRRK